MQRRDFVQAAAAGAVSLGLSPAPLSGVDDTFTFVHLADPHIQPELRASEGCRQCFQHVNALKPDFAISGGDLVFDVMETGRRRADMLFDLYRQTAAALDMPLYDVIGNHDVLGIDPASPVPYSDPLFGKKLYEDRIGPRHYFFDHKGWRFVVLDSIGTGPNPKDGYYGLIDEAQVEWLGSVLEGAGAGTPIVVATHIPVLTAFMAYARGTTVAPPRSVVVTNGKEIMELLRRFHVKAVLQGHTHVREIIEYQGCKYITSGAVSGNWWKGARMGHPEGFGLLTVRGGEVEWEYRLYGFKAESEP